MGYTRGNLEDRKKYLSWAVSESRRKLKLRAIAHMGGKCIDCGYKKCPAVLQFHHLDPKKKDFQIGGGRTRSWKRILPELKKTVLLCSNCHIERHHEESEITRQELERKIREIIPVRKPAEHGSPGKYFSGCRCDSCRRSHTKRVSDFRRSKKCVGSLVVKAAGR